MRRKFRKRFSRHWFQRKPLFSHPGMHHGTCDVPRCMSASLTRGGGENVPGVRPRRMHNPQFCVSGKRPMLQKPHLNTKKPYRFTVCCLSTESAQQIFTSLKIPYTNKRVHYLWIVAPTWRTFIIFCDDKEKRVFNTYIHCTPFGIFKSTPFKVIRLLSKTLKGKFSTKNDKRWKQSLRCYVH